MTNRTHRRSNTSSIGSLFGVLVILAVLYIPPLRNAVQDIVASAMRHFIESITPDPAPPAPTVQPAGRERPLRSCSHAPPASKPWSGGKNGGVVRNESLRPFMVRCWRTPPQ